MRKGLGLANKEQPRGREGGSIALQTLAAPLQDAAKNADLRGENHITPKTQLKCKTLRLSCKCLGRSELSASAAAKCLGRNELGQQKKPAPLHINRQHQQAAGIAARNATLDKLSQS